MWPLWWRRNLLPWEVKIRVYNACVLPILTHEMAIYVLSKSDLRALEVTHRKHLRTLWGIHFPCLISNVALYRCTKQRRLGTHIIKQRWQLFGRAMRLPPMHHIVREMSAHYAQKKRYVRGVAEQVEMEGRLVGINLKSSEEFWNLRDRARKVQQWRPVVKGIANQYEKCKQRMDF